MFLPIFLLLRRKLALVVRLAGLSILIEVEAGRGREVGKQEVGVLPDLAGRLGRFLGRGGCGGFGWLGRGRGRGRGREALLDRSHPGLPIRLDLVGAVVGGGRVRQLVDERDQQAVVVDPLLGLQLAVEIMALDRAVDGAFVGDRDQAAGADALGAAAGEIEGARVGAAPQAADAAFGHADALGGGADDAGIGQRLDELALPGGRPAVGAVAQLRGGEIKDVVRRRGGLLRFAMLVDQQLVFGGAGGEAGRDDAALVADAVGDALPISVLLGLGSEGGWVFVLLSRRRGAGCGVGEEGSEIVARCPGGCAMRESVLCHLALWTI
jgi:hypothetical protein